MVESRTEDRGVLARPRTHQEPRGAPAIPGQDVPRAPSFVPRARVVRLLLATRKKADGMEAKKPQPGVNFVDPREAPYHLKRVKPHPQILKKYHKHIFIFIEQDTNILVGGVIFSAFDPGTHQRSLEHHILVSRFPGLRRGASFLEFVYGKMVPVGFRVAARGYPGDEYGPHPVLLKQADQSQKNNNNDNIHMIFAHAEVGFTQLYVIPDYVPEVVDSICNLSDENQLKDMGSSGVSSYYCSNYMSPQHKDADVVWSLCSQLYKDLDTVGGDAKKDFNFAFTKWGLYVETRENCVWNHFAMSLTVCFTRMQLTSVGIIDRANANTVIFTMQNGAESQALPQAFSLEWDKLYRYGTTGDEEMDLSLLAVTRCRAVFGGFLYLVRLGLTELCESGKDAR
ncbi:hypothetical protein PENSPDRAFT_723076 [Peniophora sp. CONT]|nr:hypothetical protein PENSPDRAFT_723076 [Peniophora sp. CONT]